MAIGKRKIRVGVVGANERALWYGAIFDKIDPRIFAELAPASYHHFTYYMRMEPQNNKAEGFEIARIYDPDRSAAERIARAFDDRPVVCRFLDDVSEDVDLVFIANESGDGSRHLKLATPGLEKGLPTFVDRPFAFRLQDAKAMVALAKKHRAPLLSCSHMQFLPQAALFKRRFPEVGSIDMGMVHGQGPNPARIADSIALALFLFGDEFGGHVSAIQSMGAWPLEIAHLRLANERTGRILQAIAINSHTSAPRHAVHAQAICLRTPVYADNFDDFIQPEGGLAAMRALAGMVRTGIAPMPVHDMLELVAVMEAGRRSHNRSRPSRVALV